MGLLFKEALQSTACYSSSIWIDLSTKFFLLYAKEARYHKPSLTMNNKMQAKLSVTFTEMKAG